MLGQPLSKKWLPQLLDNSKITVSVKLSIPNFGHSEFLDCVKSRCHTTRGFKLTGLAAFSFFDLPTSRSSCLTPPTRLQQNKFKRSWASTHHCWHLFGGRTKSQSINRWILQHHMKLWFCKMGYKIDACSANFVGGLFGKSMHKQSVRIKTRNDPASLIMFEMSLRMDDGKSGESQI